MSDNAMKYDEILTAEQLAERLQVGVDWVYEKSRSRGQHSGEPLPVLRCGRYLRFYWPDVCKWLRGEKKQQVAMPRMTTFLKATTYQFA
jgi:hypothetical protein